MQIHRKIKIIMKEKYYKTLKVITRSTYFLYVLKKKEYSFGKHNGEG